MQTKMFIAALCIVMMQITAATAQISTNIQSGNSGATLSISIGTNTNQNKPVLNTNWGNNLNTCCNSQNNCNPNANCCGQKHGGKKHKHKKHDDCNNNWNDKKSKCCKKFDD